MDYKSYINDEFTRNILEQIEYANDYIRDLEISEKEKANLWNDFAVNIECKIKEESKK